MYYMRSEFGDYMLIKREESDIIKDLKDRFRSRLRVTPKIEVLPVENIHKMNFPAKSRKPIKFVDQRKK